MLLDMHLAKRCGAKTRRGTGANHQRCPTDAAGCMVVSRPALLKEIATGGSTGTARQRM
jgi:hypothetical protein